MTTENTEITLDSEAADRITILNLQNCRNYLIVENGKMEEKEEDGEELMPYESVEYIYNRKLIKSITNVLHFFGVN